MSIINVSVSGGTGSTTTATTGDTVDVVVGNLSVGTLPALQIAAGTGITIATSNGVSTISANLSLPSNLSDLANVQGTPTTGQVLAWNGTVWSPADDQTGGASDVANLADLSDVSATSPSSGQALTWDGSQWAAANVPVGTTVNGLSGNVTLVAGDNINVSADGQNITIGTVGQASISNLTDLVDVNSTMSPTSGQALVWNGSEWTADSVAALVSNGTTLDLGTGKILYSNIYNTLADLPAAADYHGMFAHVHNYDGLGTGAAFYAHAGNWVRLADSDDVPTALVSTINGISGTLVLSGGSGISISQSSNQLTISSTASSSTINGQTGPVSLVGGNRVDISTSAGTITASANLSGYLNWSAVPQNSSDNGSAGEVAYGGQYFYLHNGTQWNRVLLSSFGGTGGNVTTYRLLTESSDTLLTEGGDYLSHDGTGTTSSGNWTQVYSDIDGAAASAQIEQAALNNNGTTMFVAAPQQTQLRMFVDNGTAWAEQTSSAFSLSLSSGLWPQYVSASSAGDKVLTLALDAYESGNATEFHAALLADSGGWSLADRIYSGSCISSAACLALSSDGSRAIVSTYSGSYGSSGDDRTLRLYDTSSNLSELASVGNGTDGLSQLGLSVAIDGDGSRVAATYSTGSFIWNGSSYVWDGSPQREGVKTFDYSGGNLTAVGGNLTGTASTDQFGYSMSLSDGGSRLAVGAPYGAGGGTQRGYVRVYDWSGSAWVQSGSDITGSADGDLAGWSVDLSAAGTRLVVGLRQRDGNGTDSGATRVYDWDGTAWAQIGTDITGSSSYDYSGSGVAISGDGSRIALGASGNDDGGSNAGQVRVFEAS